MNIVEIFFDWYPDHGDGSFEICCFTLIMTAGVLWMVRQQRKRRSSNLAPGGKARTL
jgi:hypothetical protein